MLFHDSQGNEAISAQGRIYSDCSSRQGMRSLSRMPSYAHQLLLLLFRNHSGSAADLLREINVPLPGYDEVRIESSDLSDLRPAEYQADLVFVSGAGQAQGTRCHRGGATRAR
jgi:hypothetical protein